MILPEVVFLTPLATRRIRDAGGPSVRGRLRGLADALRFARIPLLCAVVVAIASADPRGRLLAIAIAVVVVGAGLALHGRELLFGGPRRPPAAE